MRASPIACSRRAGSLRRHRRMIRCSPGPTEDGSCAHSGSVVNTAARISGTESPEKAGLPASISKSTQPNAQMSLRLSAALATLLLAIQIALGGWVSTNYAVLACSTFPQCQGNWWPVMDFAQAFSLWRPLGMTRDGRPIDFEALTAIHYTHRLMAYLVLVLLGALAWRWKRHGFMAAGRWLNVLLLWQLLTGVSNVLFDWPLMSAVAHTGGSAALLLCLSWTWFTTRMSTTVTISSTLTRPLS